MTGKIPINLTLEPAVDIIYIPELKLQNHNYKKNSFRANTKLLRACCKSLYLSSKLVKI